MEVTLAKVPNALSFSEGNTDRAKISKHVPFIANHSTGASFLHIGVGKSPKSLKNHETY